MKSYSVCNLPSEILERILDWQKRMVPGDGIAIRLTEKLRGTWTLALPNTIASIVVWVLLLALWWWLPWKGLLGILCFILAWKGSKCLIRCLRDWGSVQNNMLIDGVYVNRLYVMQIFRGRLLVWPLTELACVRTKSQNGTEDGMSASSLILDFGGRQLHLCSGGVELIDEMREKIEKFAADLHLAEKNGNKEYCQRYDLLAQERESKVDERKSSVCRFISWLLVGTLALMLFTPLYFVNSCRFNYVPVWKFPEPFPNEGNEEWNMKMATDMQTGAKRLGGILIYSRSDAVFELHDASSHDCIMRGIVHATGNAFVAVAPGCYNVSHNSGKTWYGNKWLFGNGEKFTEEGTSVCVEPGKISSYVLEINDN